MRKENPEQDGTPAPEEEPLDELSLRFLNAVHDRDDFEVLQHIIDEGANVNAKNPDGQTALHVAIHNGDTSMVQFLLEKGADPEATAPNGNKPLYDAAESGHFEIVELLLDFNANVEAFNINEKRSAFYQVSLSSTRIDFLLIVCSEPETLLLNS
jgi:ankyrin repeat protein